MHIISNVWRKHFCGANNAPCYNNNSLCAMKSHDSSAGSMFYSISFHVAIEAETDRGKEVYQLIKHAYEREKKQMAPVGTEWDNASEIIHKISNNRQM